MPKLTKRLNKTVVESLTDPGYYMDAALPGFWLRVHKTKDGQITRTYLVIKKLKNSRKQTSVSIGRHGGIMANGTKLNAEQARVEAEKIIGVIRAHKNPVKERESALMAVETARHQKETLESLTLERVLMSFLEHNRSRLAVKTAKDYEGHTRRSLADWLPVPMAQITERMVKDRHMQISLNHQAKADYTMRILRTLFNYATEEFKDDEHNPLIARNPVRKLKWNKVARRDSFVTKTRLADWFAEVEKIPNPTARDYLQLVILTGLRHQEAAGLLWENVDLSEKTLMVKDTKNGTDHKLPMSDYLYWLLKRRHDESDNEFFVFPGRSRGHLKSVRGCLSNIQALTRTDDAKGVKSTVHDLRRTFTTYAEGLDISPYTIKKLLNHKMTTDVTAGYVINEDRLREAMQRITDEILKHAKVKKPWLSKRRK